MAIISNGTTIISSGALASGIGGTNTPAFSAERNGAQAISANTRTTILFNNEFYDSDGGYDTSTGKFTPQTAGKYYVSATVMLDSDANSNYHYGFIELYKNSSVITESNFDDRSGADARVRTANPTAIVDMNGSTDFVLIQVYMAAQSDGSLVAVSDMSTFQAFKIIE
jgi:hypothetical protein